jgi:hypothetical protein
MEDRIRNHVEIKNKIWKLNERFGFKKESLKDFYTTTSLPDGV